jgi:hypothetical protein
MQLSVDGKIPKEFWIILLLLVTAGASHESILELIL